MFSVYLLSIRRRKAPIFGNMTALDSESARPPLACYMIIAYIHFTCYRQRIDPLAYNVGTVLVTDLDTSNFLKPGPQFRPWHLANFQILLISTLKGTSAALLDLHCVIYFQSPIAIIQVDAFDVSTFQP